MRSFKVLLALATLLLVPAAAACEGLSPGDAVVSGDSACTLAFIVADENGLYFTTAGHCIQENATAKNPDLGTFGVGVFHYLVPETGSTSDGSPGHDFALIRIDPSYYDKLNPKVCGWNGPTGIYDSKPGSGEVHHYGYGMVFGDVPETRARTGYNLQNDNTAFHWTGMGVPGDSGSAVLAADGRALGVLTHLVVALPDTNGGTHLLRGFDLAQEKGFTNLRLVLAGEDPVKVLQELRADAARPADPAPAPGAKTNATNTTQAPPASNATQPSPGKTNGTTTTPTGEPLQPQGVSDVKPAPGFEVALMAVAGLAALLRRRA